ncbi:MAG: hypothetical protein QW331_03025 [Candidatus Woesearchaeota archaeon]
MVDTEKKIVVERMNVEYKGIFSVKDMINDLKRNAEELGYTRTAKEDTYETVTPESRSARIELRLQKAKFDYMQFLIKVIINLNNMREITTTIDGKKVKLDQGEANIHFMSFIITEMKGHWTSRRPTYYFFKGLKEKFINIKEKLMYDAELANDTKILQKNLKAHLNLYKYRVEE